MKIRFVGIMLSAFLLISAVAWSSGQKGTTAAEKAKIVFWFPSANPTNDEYFSSLGPAFMEKNPNIEVETIVVPASSADIVQKLNAALLSKTYPDVFSAFLVYIGSRGARGEFLDLKDYFGKWSDRDDILENTIEMGKYKGTLIGLGYFPAPVIRVYRKDWFAEAGLDPEKGPGDSWEDLARTAKKAAVYDANGNLQRAGMDLPSSDLALVFNEPFMRQNGSIVIDEINQKPSFTDDGAIEAMQFLADLHNQNVSFPHEWVDFDNHPFVNNRSAMGNIMTSAIMNLLKNDPNMEKNMGYAPVMKRKQKWAFCGYRFFVIGADSKYKDASWEFTKFMMSPEEMWKRYELLAIPPVRKSMMEKFIADAPVRNQTIANYVEFGKGKPITPWTHIYNRYVKVAYEEALSKSKTARQALMDAEAGLLEELKKFAP